MSHIISVPIKGMHCRSCEILVEEELKELKNIEKVEVNHKQGQAIIHYTGNTPSDEEVKSAIVKAGYSVGVADELTIFSRDKNEYKNLGLAFLFLTILYLLLDRFGLTSFSLASDLGKPSLGFILLVGLVAGFSTCMALVGGLSLGLSTKFLKSHPEAGAAQRFRPHLYFILGRIVSYAFFGGLLGALGTLIKISSTANGIITTILGFVMIVMGLQIINIFPRLNNIKLTLPKGIARAFGISRSGKEYSHTNSMILGAITFFLPCGFTQAMQLYAVTTGSFVSGAIVLGLFAIGSAPGLLSIGGLTSLVRGNFKEWFFKVAGLAVIFFGLFNLNNCYTLASLQFGIASDKNTSQTQEVNDPNVLLQNGVQIVHMIESRRGYSPNKFLIKKGIPVKWVIDAQAPSSCASAIILPKLNIERSLMAGENIIEFTPTESGDLPFSCSMGMYSGVFSVVE